ncbi:NAD-dependent malic enzyme (NAD-dependent malic enzyme (conversion of malate into pyruvate)) [Nostocoides japonicum T1-X7]|uniref:NAD-dependent malic enzyme (NAD-dependent malic enzyme (Conversion of malate into pyruvate)) n=1 Tax=Nostocoides japonicum T1-X7 TaxID=1194083 RepID=A0A077M0R0_9MICO|nr:NAD-dependent malic enzyme [Tetrasphaera japonica]CCH77800.1 NAD-dependent malic enzyme (NAD-dependent malic enzyme (conversion of malate into pyruvate)) [Tetrasphaera japonica T1-X7]
MTTTPSISYSFTARLVLPARATAISELTSCIEREGGAVSGLDVTAADNSRLRVDLTVAAADTEQADRIVATMRSVPGVEMGKVSDRTFLAHLGGKLRIEPRVPIRNRDDLSLIYTPGVARVCMAIANQPSDARNLTIKGNTIAVVTDGTAVLGLGDIGPLAALPVMEGKAALFKRFADIDAFPICLDTTDTEEIIAAVKAISPVFAGINLEDISAPRCFEIEERLRRELDIPVFHDDQHGTAIVVLAALRNALRVAGKGLPDVRIVMSGAGAAGTAILKLLLLAGARDVVVSDADGIVTPTRPDIASGENPSLMWSATHTNPREVSGTLRDALVGADVFVGVSAPNILTGDDIATMAPDSVVFALANPVPEVDLNEAAQHALVVASGRSDFANQINNVLVFPGVFRGLLNASSRKVTPEVLLAAADALAGVVRPEELNPTYIVPSVFHPDVTRTVANAVSSAAAGR